MANIKITKEQAQELNRSVGYVGFKIKIGDLLLQMQQRIEALENNSEQGDGSGSGSGSGSG